MQGFHSNDARGVTSKIDPATGQPIDSVDPLVRSFGYELGVRGFVNERLNTSLSLWALNLDSELLFVGDAGNTEANVSANFSNGWFMNTRVRYFGDSPLEETGSITSDSSTLANFRVGFRQDNRSFKADILNALDSNDDDIDYYYVSRLSSEPSGAAIEDIHYHVLEPRTVRLSATYHF